MRTIITLLLSALPAFPALAITTVTGCAYSSAGSGVCPAGVGTFSAPAGALIIVGLSAATTATNMTVADNIDGAYTLIGTTDNIANNRHAPAWYKVSSGGNVQVTATCPSCNQIFSIMVEVVTGQASGTSWIDQTDLSSSSAAATSCTSTFTRTGNEYIMQIGLAETVASAVWSTATSSPGTVTVGSNTTNGSATEPGVISYQYITSGTTYTIAIGSGQNVRTACNGFSIKEAGGTTAIRHRVTNQ